MSGIAAADLEIQLSSLKKSANAHFKYYQKENEALVLLNNNVSYFIFLQYIPKGTKTSLASIKDSLENKMGISRISTGEWVVDKIYLADDVSHEAFRKIISVYQ